MPKPPPHAKNYKPCWIGCGEPPIALHPSKRQEARGESRPPPHRRFIVSPCPCVPIHSTPPPVRPRRSPYPPVRTRPLHPTTRACLAAPPRHPCVPVPSLPRRVRAPPPCRRFIVSPPLCPSYLLHSPHRLRPPIRVLCTTYSVCICYILRPACQPNPRSSASSV